ncbi:hypothetical protein, partial [Viscerimonas tarda]
RNGSVWKGVTSADSAKVYFTPNVVSANINGTAISTIYNDSLRNDTLQCKIVVVNVEFEEDPSQKWGFDENDPTKEDDYPSFRTAPVQGIKWKSLKNDGISDNILVKAIPNGAEKAIKFVLSDPNFQIISFTPTANSKYQLSIKTTSAINADLIPQIGYFTNDSMQMKLHGMGGNSQKVRIIIVHESNDDVQVVPFGNTTASDTTVVISSGNNKFLDSRRRIDILGDDQVIYNSAMGDSVVIAGTNKICESRAHNMDIKTTLISMVQLQDTLNKYYSQSVYKWEVKSIEERSINFDLNKDGQIDVSTWNTPEMKVIADSCVRNATMFSIIVVDNPNDGSNGFSEFPINNPQKLAFVHPANAPQIYMTICHELGHGAFNLQHPFHEFSGFPKGRKDILNIMNYGIQRNKFRKYQWEKIK